MKRVKKVVEEIRLTATELSEYLDLSVARIGQLEKIGVLEKGPDGHYDLSLSVISYGRYILCPRLYDRFA
jgi:hypothetical protein